MTGDPGRKRSAYMRAAAADNTLPMDRAAVDLWLRDTENPLRWLVRPLLQFVFAILLHVTWLLKRLPLPQFRAHRLLQRMICWFCRNFVSPEANLLILRHFATESNILNFLRDNSNAAHVPPLDLYPQKIDDLLAHTFVRHDQELFRMFRELGPWDESPWPKPAGSTGRRSSSATRWVASCRSRPRLVTPSTWPVSSSATHRSPSPTRRSAPSA